MGGLAAWEKCSKETCFPDTSRELVLVAQARPVNRSTAAIITRLNNTEIPSSSRTRSGRSRIGLVNQHGCIATPPRLQQALRSSACRRRNERHHRSAVRDKYPPGLTAAEPPVIRHPTRRRDHRGNRVVVFPEAHGPLVLSSRYQSVISQTDQERSAATGVNVQIMINTPASATPDHARTGRADIFNDRTARWAAYEPST